MTPVRIQRKRTKGWRMPEGTIYVGRPTKWGNPWQVGAPSAYWSQGPGRSSPMRPDPIPAMSAQEVTAIYRNSLRTGYGDVAHLHFSLEELRGHDLACWCPVGRPCHADVLLEMANR